MHRPPCTGRQIRRPRSARTAHSSRTTHAAWRAGTGALEDRTATLNPSGRSRRSGIRGARAGLGHNDAAHRNCGRYTGRGRNRRRDRGWCFRCGGEVASNRTSPRHLRLLGSHRRSRGSRSLWCAGSSGDGRRNPRAFLRRGRLPLSSRCCRGGSVDRRSCNHRSGWRTAGNGWCRIYNRRLLARLRHNPAGCWCGRRRRDRGFRCRPGQPRIRRVRRRCRSGSRAGPRDHSRRTRTRTRCYARACYGRGWNNDGGPGRRRISSRCLCLLALHNRLQGITRLGDSGEVNCRPRLGLLPTSCRSRPSTPQIAADLLRLVCLNRARVGLRFCHANSRQRVQNGPALYLKLPCKIVDSNFAHPSLLSLLER
jgi:hypothetical protein